MRGVIALVLVALGACSSESGDVRVGLPTRDDFSDAGSGWSQNRAENSTTIVAQYEDDAFLLKTNIASERATSTLMFDSEDDTLHLEADAQLRSSPTRGVFYGLACAGPPQNGGYARSFYALLIDRAGRPIIQRPPDENGVGYEHLRTIGREVPDFDPQARHRIGVDCSSDDDGTAFSIAVDGETVAKVEVDEAAGPFEAASLVLVTNGPMGAEVVFDDFEAER